MYLDFAREPSKPWNMRVTVIIVVKDGPQSPRKGARRVANRRMNRYHPNYSIKIGQCTEKCPGDLRRFAVPQTPTKNYPLMLVWATRKNYNDNKDNFSAILL